MSLGNGNPKEGDKGSNFNYELKVLQGLDNIATYFENDNEPKTFTADGIIVTGSGAQPVVSCVVTIPPGVITSNCTIEVKAKFRRTGGTTTSGFFWVYVTDVGLVAPGNIYPGYGFSAGRSASLASSVTCNFIRTVNINSSNFFPYSTAYSLSSGLASDYGTFITNANPNIIITGSPYYIHFVASTLPSNTTMTGICEKAIVSVYY